MHQLSLNSPKSSNDHGSEVAPPPQLPNKPFKFVINFIRHYKLALSFMLLFEIIQASCQILIPYAIKRLIDSGSLATGNFAQAFDSLWPQLKIFLYLSLGILFASRASGALLAMVGPALRRRVRRVLFHYLQHHSQRYFIGNFAGSLANRISEVAMGVNHSLWTIMFDFLPVLITFSFSFYLIYQTHVVLGSFLGAWLLIYIFVSFFLARRCQTYAKAFANARSTVSGKIVDGVTNALNTKIFSRLGFERQYIEKQLTFELETARRTFWFMEGMRWFQFVSTMILQVVIVLLALKFWVEGKMTVGSFAMVTSLSLLLINEARGLSRRFLEFFEYLGNISEGVSIIVRPHEVIDQPQAHELKVDSGRVEFKNVNFAYKDGATVFSNLSITLKPGERVGLVGFSGSGKTTFTNLLLRMFDLQSGSIEIDKQDIAKVSQDSLRSQISVIPQEPMLFHRSLLENIRYGRIEATDEEVVAAAKLARAHDFISNIKEGYSSLVGERGVKLSGGQRQRIAIARAFLKASPILIMDEATSSLDSVTEDLIQQSMQTLLKDKTVIVVAHRLSTIAKLDRILVFDKGQIIEDGSHAELISRNGHYAMLWRRQVGGFLPENEDQLDLGL